jgi:hypothetical protein
MKSPPSLNGHRGYVLLAILILSPTVNLSAAPTSLPSPYTENNQGKVSFDVSVPIDHNGFTLHGYHLKGGSIHFTSKATWFAPLLAHEQGNFTLPSVMAIDGTFLIKTRVKYDAIKLVDPIGSNNVFIKVGIAHRTQTMSGTDPYVLKKGAYTWQVPIFSFGTEINDENNKATNQQLMMVTGVDEDNSIYTQQFYLFTEGRGNQPIAAAELEKISSQSYSSSYFGYAAVNWAGGGVPPGISKNSEGGTCQGTVTTFPVGPGLDYEYGYFKLPTWDVPWSAPKSEHCVVLAKRKAGCLNASIASDFHYIAQKIRVPVNDKISLYAEFGTVYRTLVPKNIPYRLGDAYLKKIVPLTDYGKKHFLPGGYMAPYFAVGYEVQADDHTRYSARYIYLPIKENANRLRWADSPVTELYVISSSSTQSLQTIPDAVQKSLNDALEIIHQKMPAVYEVLGKHFFVDILKNNHVYNVPILNK